jgi:membrane-bound lytic murein transglycosylase MltF
MQQHPLLSSTFLASAILKNQPLSSQASRPRSSQLPAASLALCALLLFAITGCNTKPAPPQVADQTKQEQPAPAAPPSSDLLPSQDAVATAQTGKGAGLTLPVAFAKHTGDLDDMVKRRTIRALVIIDPISFFYQKGLPKGVTYEALEEFQKYVNDKFKTGTLKVKVVYTPLRPDQMEAALNEGIGDIIATPVVITPEREQKVAFTTPIAQHVTQLIVTGPSLPNVNSFDDLAGKDIYANPVTTYYDNLNKLNAERQKAGKAPFIVKAADKNLLDDDLVEMVNAGLIPATVTTKLRAGLWTQVFPNLTAHQDMTIATEGSVAYALRKNNPQLKALLDEFIQTHGVGTSFGNTLQRRYLQNTKWIKNSTNTEEMQKFNANIQFFKQYATQYNFDYLMLAAQGYQESLLDQSRRNPSGAVGIMQVIPKYAAAKPIGVTNVNVAEGNIHAGAAMMRNIADELRQLQRRPQPHRPPAQEGGGRRPRSQCLVRQRRTRSRQRHRPGNRHLRRQYLQILRRLHASLGSTSGETSRHGRYWTLRQPHSVAR